MGTSAHGGLEYHRYKPLSVYHRPLKKDSIYSDHSLKVEVRTILCMCVRVIVSLPAHLYTEHKGGMDMWGGSRSRTTIYAVANSAHAHLHKHLMYTTAHVMHVMDTHIVLHCLAPLQQNPHEHSQLGYKQVVPRSRVCTLGLHL